MENKTPKRILIVGGGFAGLTVAMELERKLGRDASVEITLITRENFFPFTPMLHEVAARFEKKLRVALDWTPDLNGEEAVRFFDHCAARDEKLACPVIARPGTFRFPNAWSRLRWQ